VTIITHDLKIHLSWISRYRLDLVPSKGGYSIDHHFWAGHSDCWVMPSLTDVNWRMHPMLWRMLVAQLKLCNRGYMPCIWWMALSSTLKKYWLQHLVNFPATEVNLEDWARLNPNYTENDKFRTNTLWQMVYFSLPHTPLSHQSLWTPHTAATMHRGLRIPGTDSNIAEWQRFEKIGILIWSVLIYTVL
jgi:hypothetical protein